MPEGPEVYVMTVKFKKRFPPGSKLLKIIPLHTRYENIPKRFIDITPLTIKKIYTRGKKSIINFGEWSLLVSYGMSGHWEINKGKYSQLHFKFDRGDYYWVSSRNLPICSVQFLKKDELERELDKLGLDIIRDNPLPNDILAVYGKCRRRIATFLLDQTKFSGIGNYIRAVVLYRCGISPHRTVDSLCPEELILIWDIAKQVSKEAISAKGMGIRDYKDENGNVVGINFDITPYNCEYDSLGNSVIAETIEGRTIWWVREMQN